MGGLVRRGSDMGGGRNRHGGEPTRRGRVRWERKKKEERMPGSRYPFWTLLGVGPACVVSGCMVALVGVNAGAVTGAAVV